MRFHRKCGDKVTLLNDYCSAVRNFTEFNYGLILSSEPLTDDVMFEVRIDRKVTVWNGNIEIGVTTLDPDCVELPATATKLKNTSWILSGNTIFKDGVMMVRAYGEPLDSLGEGDRVGVMRSSQGELIFFINGKPLGVAVVDMPPRLFGVIDLYGQCVQVSVVQSGVMMPIMESSLDQIEEVISNDDPLTLSDVLYDGSLPILNVLFSLPDDSNTSAGACALPDPDKLKFHPRCGILVKLSANNTSAERVRPLDDYNNGVIMTHRPLHDNELFEVRIDRLVDKWSGSIEVGVTTHNPASMRFPSTMTNMDTGTIMMSGSKVLVNGHGSAVEYGAFNLDELREGDTIGLMRRGNGDLHYFINSVDQGIVTSRVDLQIWGVIDLYGMTVKVSIVDPNEEIDSNINHVASSIMNTPHSVSVFDNTYDVFEPTLYSDGTSIDEEGLLFHTLRDSNIVIVNNCKTAHRLNAFDFFNNGIVMTNRTLKSDELFQVRLDLIIPKWAGSIEIGITQLSCNEIEPPFKMSNASTGTWVLTGEDVMQDGAIIVPQYVRSLNQLSEGDTVGVMRKDSILHFFVNGIDQGPAAINIPEHVYGVVDLYGRVAQVTIVDNYMPPPLYSPESPISSESNNIIYPEMCFHRVHGRNAALHRKRLSAHRTTVYSEFNHAVLFSSRPLRECEMFEIRIDKMVDCWIGSIEIGVTAIKPDDLEADGVSAVAGTATDLDWDTYILSGSSMMKDGECVRSGYPLDLDTLTINSRVGLMWHADRSLHYYLDGMDQGKAWYVPHLNIYAVVDLYGQCTQVTILQNEERTFNYNGCTNSENIIPSNIRPCPVLPPPYSFSEYHGANVRLLYDYAIARKINTDSYSSLVFSASHLVVGELFEVKLLEQGNKCAGSLRMGITDVNILNAHINRRLPPSIASLPHFTAYIDGRFLKYSSPGGISDKASSVVPSFEWLRPCDRIGLKKTSDSRVLIYYNAELLDVAFENVPDKVYVVLDLQGRMTTIQAISKLVVSTGITIPQPSVSSVQEIVEASTSGMAEVSVTASTSSGNAISPIPPRRVLPYTFCNRTGENIKLLSSDTVAMRETGYSDGMAIVHQPLPIGSKVMFRVDKIEYDYVGTAGVGGIVCYPDRIPLPSTVLGFTHSCWCITSDFKNNNGDVYCCEDAAALQNLSLQSIITLHFHLTHELILSIDNNFITVIGKIPARYSSIYPVIDLYGKIVQVSILLNPQVLAAARSCSDLIGLEEEGQINKCNIKSLSIDNIIIKEYQSASSPEVDEDERQQKLSKESKATILYYTIKIEDNYSTDAMSSEKFSLILSGRRQEPDTHIILDDNSINTLSDTVSTLIADTNEGIVFNFISSKSQKTPPKFYPNDGEDVVFTLVDSDLINSDTLFNLIWMVNFLEIPNKKIALIYYDDLSNTYINYKTLIRNCKKFYMRSLPLPKLPSTEWVKWSQSQCDHAKLVHTFWTSYIGHSFLNSLFQDIRVRCMCFRCAPDAGDYAGWFRIEVQWDYGVPSSDNYKYTWYPNKLEMQYIRYLGNDSRSFMDRLLENFENPLPEHEAPISTLNTYGKSSQNVNWNNYGEMYDVAVSFEVQTPPNCSFCQRLWAILIYVPNPPFNEEKPREIIL